jgi:hypothetical protein
MADGAKADENKRRVRWRTWAGLAGTLLWLTLAAWWTFYRPLGTWCIPADMPPNAWGDWAGGTFAPLAFLWLVLGYFQQGEELRDNVKALRLQENALQLQVRELKDSVEQQSALAEAARTQAAFLGQSHALAVRAQLLPHQPLPHGFRVVSDAPSGHLVLVIYNNGAAVTDVRATLHIIDEPETEPIRVGDWHRTSAITIPVDLGRRPLPFNASLFLTYTDELSFEQSQRFYLGFNRDNAAPMRVGASRESISFNIPG